MNAARWCDSGWRVSAAYLALAVATTWPLVLHLGSSLPADLGDPVLNAFILDWGLTHLSALAGGDLSAFRTFWHAPIFHPAPLALAYSEHLLTQAVTIWPVYALGGNILLCYNLLFLGTFVLSGLGMYLFTRELTGSGPAAFVAGLLYGFALYRVPQFSHLQTLSSQWLPFALYGLRRFFTTRRVLPLCGATLALVAQNLSNGYFLIFFAPLVAAYCLVEIVDRRAWRDRRVVSGLAGAAAATIAATLPVLVPYLALREMGFERRSLDEVKVFSADLFAWATASRAHRVWGWLVPVRKAEGELFPGLVTIALAALGTGTYFARMWRTAPAEPSRFRRIAVWVLAAAAAAALGFTLLVEATGDPHWRLAGFRVTMRIPARGYISAAVLAAASAMLSRRARHFLRGEESGLVGFFLASAAATAMLTFGPTLQVGMEDTGVPMPYSVLYHHVPGFDGLRVPARYAMATIACLSVLAAFGARHLLALGRGGRGALVAAAILFMAESTSAPITINRPSSRTAAAEAGPPRLYVGEDVPGVYKYLRGLPETTVVLEFPYGSLGWDVQAVFYQRAHRHPLVNGFSGGAPRSYVENLSAFDHVDVVPRAAWQRVRSSGATHIVVHRKAMKPPRLRKIEAWLIGCGARLIKTFGDDALYAVEPLDGDGNGGRALLPDDSKVAAGGSVRGPSGEVRTPAISVRSRDRV